MALTTRITTDIRAELTKTTLDHGAVSHSPSLTKNKDLASGTSSGQADVYFSDKRTIAASGTDSLDLAGGLTDAFGTSITFVKLKYIKVTTASGNTNNVNLTRPATNGVPLFLAAGDGIPVLPDGMIEWLAPGAGVTVTAATGDLIDLVNSAGGTSVEYDIVLIGTSA